MSRRQLVVIVVAGVALGLFVAAQLIIPSVAENDVESRLTEGGGSAEVSMSAFPVVRLLWDDGDRVEITGEDLNLSLVDETDVFEKLDGFDEVDVSVTDSTFGPFAISSFDLTRSGDEHYQLTSSSTASLADLGEFGAESLGIPGSSIIGGVLDFFGGGGNQLPIELDMQLESDGGSVDVVSGGGTVAGIPAGPLAELIVGAIASQL